MPANAINATKIDFIIIPEMFGEEGSAVYLCNQEYWEINNLRVKNWSDDGQDKERSGIRVEAYGGGTYHQVGIQVGGQSLVKRHTGIDGQQIRVHILVADGHVHPL